MQNNDQKGSLKDTFNEFGAAPTEGLWNAISDKLDDDKKKRRFAIWWWSTGLAAVLVVGFTVWNWNQPTGTNQQGNTHAKHTITESTSEKPVSPKGGTLAIAADSIASKVPFVFTWDPSMFPFSFNFDPHPYHYMSDSYPGYYPWPSIELPVLVLGESNADSLNIEKLLVARVDSSDPAPTDSTVRPMEVQQLLLSVRITKWEVGLFAGRSLAITQSNPLINGQESTTPSSMAVNPPVETKYSWNADLTISKQIYRRWWLGTGVHFGLLQSGTIPETSNYKSGKISYMSFGIPLSLGREYWFGGRFNITPMVGFRYDYAFRKTEEYTYQPGLASISSADALPGYSKTSGTAHLHLVSAFAAAEVKFRLRGNWGLVAKPMAQFYVFGQTDESTPNTFRNAWVGGSIGVTKRF
ncbi:MAG: hypothetical protein V4604_03740 [Bacteroidota bacterium]